MLRRAFITWFALLGLAILNGSARTVLLIPRYGERAGHVVSTLLLCGLILLVTWLAVPWRSAGPSPPGPW
ncbi:MAG TPA: hypothetical protein VH879_05870 [Gemmatimonadales bacterium]|jgi:hypothetical protein